MSEEFDNIISLEDEDGKEVKFEFLDLVEYDNREFILLLPVPAEDGGTVAILEVLECEDDPEMEEYVSVEEQDVLDAVFEKFKKEFEDDFNFIED
ncbi:MAG: DUF1292 domain-containing protein [Lachnospiraceae bacterium]|nr:DUF1292 domain-containing protein [Lachnospiraceae bacterium]